MPYMVKIAQLIAQNCPIFVKFDTTMPYMVKIA